MQHRFLISTPKDPEAAAACSLVGHAREFRTSPPSALILEHYVHVGALSYLCSLSFVPSNQVFKGP